MMKQLITHTDERGFFREIARHTDLNFAQLSHSYKRTGYFTEEFHLHRHQTDYWYIPIGVMRVVLCKVEDWLNEDTGEYAFTAKAGDYTEIITTGEELITIPPMTAHGLKVLEGPAHLFYITNKIYNPADEGRIKLDYDWLK